MKRFILFLIRLYQSVSRSGGLGVLSFGSFSGCRQWPTCSEYTYEAVTTYGVFRGGARAARRIARCFPLSSS